MQTVLEVFVEHWVYLSTYNREDCAGLITGLFDTLASENIPPPNYLLLEAGRGECKPVIENIFKLAKTDPVFREKLMQHTDGLGPLGSVAWIGSIGMVRYLCQQDDGIEALQAHASNRDKDGWNILVYCCSYNPKVEMVELLLDRFP